MHPDLVHLGRVTDAIPARRMTITMRIATFEVAFLTQVRRKFVHKAPLSLFDAALGELKGCGDAAVRMHADQMVGQQALERRF